MRIKDATVIDTFNSRTFVESNKDKFRVTRFDDITGILKFNQEMRKDETQRNGFSKDRDLRWIGRIPQGVFIEHYRKYPEARDPDGTYWADFLSKAENEVFRTVPKIVGGPTKFL